MINIGVIGGGFGVRVQAPAFQSDPRCRVAGLWARNLNQAKKNAAKLRIPVVYPSWRAMIEDACIDAVTIAVPPFLQTRIAALALERGKHVFLEKPLAGNLKEALRLNSSLRFKKSATAMVDFEFPEINTWRRAKDLLRRKRLGSLQSVSFQWILPPLSNKDPRSWVDRPSQGGGLLRNFGSHVFFDLEWLLGPVRRIKALIKEPHAVVMGMEFNKKLFAFVQISRSSVRTQIHKLMIHGEDGFLKLENKSNDHVKGFQLIHSNYQNGRRTILREKSNRADGRIRAVASIAKKFITSIRTRTRAHPNLHDALRVERLMAAALRSNKLKKWMTV